MLEIETLRSKHEAGGGRRADAAAWSAEECILGHLSARKELLQACYALRDALTNRQQRRRLQALAKHRAERAQHDEHGPQEREEGQPGGGRDVPEGGESPPKPKPPPDGPSGAEQALARPRSPRGERDDGDGCVDAAAAGIANLTTGSKQTAGDEQSPGASSSSSAGDGRVDHGEGDESEGGVTSTEAPTREGQEHEELVLEGSGIGAEATAQRVAPSIDEDTGTAAQGGEERQGPPGEQDRAEAEEEDVEAPLEAMSRSGTHLEAAARALDALLKALSSGSSAGLGGRESGATLSSRHDAERPAPAPPTPPARQETGEETPRKVEGSGEGGEEPRTGKHARGEGEGQGLGGVEGGFAFEVEMNRHLLGSSPQQHVRFRRKAGAGPRALRCLASETARACGVVRCQDLSDVREYLLRFSQPPLDVSGMCFVSRVCGQRR